MSVSSVSPYPWSYFILFYFFLVHLLASIQCKWRLEWRERTTREGERVKVDSIGLRGAEQPTASESWGMCVDPRVCRIRLAHLLTRLPVSVLDIAWVWEGRCIVVLDRFVSKNPYVCGVSVDALNLNELYSSLSLPFAHYRAAPRERCQAPRP